MGTGIETGFFLYSDAHFFHKNIIKYSERPFNTVQQMNRTMIDNWNGVVGNDDTIYFLGDFVIGHFKSQFAKLISEELNGNIIFIKGNHDRGVKSIPMEKNINITYKGKDIILTHEPLKEFEGINIHGHVHNNTYDKKENQINVSAEVIDYTPIHIDKALELL